jgi:hypothetical protein
VREFAAQSPAHGRRSLRRKHEKDWKRQLWHGTKVTCDASVEVTGKSVLLPPSKQWAPPPADSWMQIAARKIKSNYQHAGATSGENSSSSIGSRISSSSISRSSGGGGGGGDGGAKVPMGSRDETV